MLKQILLFFLRGAIGFFMITALFAFTLQPDTIDPASGDRLTQWFYFGTMKLWLGCVGISLCALIFKLPKKLSEAIKWSPVYLPVLYGIGMYIYLNQAAL